MLEASGLNGGLVALLVREGRRKLSPALIAEGAHLWADVKSLPEPSKRRSATPSRARSKCTTCGLGARDGVPSYTLHLIVPAAMTVAEAHAICDRIEAAVAEALPGARVTTHVEPEGKAKRLGSVVRMGESDPLRR